MLIFIWKGYTNVMSTTLYMYIVLTKLQYNLLLESDYKIFISRMFYLNHLHIYIHVITVKKRKLQSSLKQANNYKIVVQIKLDEYKTLKSSLNLYRREYVRSFIIVHHGEKEFVWILLIVSPRVCQDCVLIICLSIKKTPMYTAMELRQSWLNILDPKLYINR